jgi:hypothetical protein
MSAIRSGVMGMRPSTRASTERLFRRLMTRTLVLKDKLGWLMVSPAFDALYEAFPVWVWAKQRTETNNPKTKTAPARFIETSYFCVPNFVY